MTEPGGVIRKGRQRRVPTLEWAGGPQVNVEGDWKNEKIITLEKMTHLARRIISEFGRQLPPELQPWTKLYFVRLYASNGGTSFNYPAMHLELILRYGYRGRQKTEPMCHLDPIELGPNYPRKAARKLARELYSQIDFQYFCMTETRPSTSSKYMLAYLQAIQKHLGKKPRTCPKYKHSLVLRHGFGDKGFTCTNLQCNHREK